MKKICKVTVNDEPFLANCGDLLLDWALMNGVDLPHDCRSGICGACKVHLVDGKVFGGQTSGDDMIHACQARIISDLQIAIEAAPEPTTLPGTRITARRIVWTSHRCKVSGISVCLNALNRS